MRHTERKDYGFFPGRKTKMDKNCSWQSTNIALELRKSLTNGLTCAQRAKGNHGQRSKGNQENDISINWECQQRDKNFKKGPSGIFEAEKYNNWHEKFTGEIE